MMAESLFIFIESKNEIPLTFKNMCDLLWRGGDEAATPVDREQLRMAPSQGPGGCPFTPHRPAVSVPRTLHLSKSAAFCIACHGTIAPTVSGLMMFLVTVIANISGPLCPSSEADRSTAPLGTASTESTL